MQQLIDIPVTSFCIVISVDFMRTLLCPGHIDALGPRNTAVVVVLRN